MWRSDVSTSYWLFKELYWYYYYGQDHYCACSFIISVSSRLIHIHINDWIGMYKYMPKYITTHLQYRHIHIHICIVYTYKQTYAMYLPILHANITYIKWGFSFLVKNNSRAFSVNNIWWLHSKKPYTRIFIFWSIHLWTIWNVFSFLLSSPSKMKCTSSLQNTAKWCALEKMLRELGWS